MATGNTRYVGRMLQAARRKGHATSYSANQGIDDPEALEMMNDGLEYIISEIQRRYPDTMTKSIFMDSVSGTSEYAKPARLMDGGRIINIQFSTNGLWIPNSYHYNLNGPVPEFNRTYYLGYPDSYGFTDDILWFTPVPSLSLTNGFRIIYREEPCRLDIRRGVIKGGAGNTSINTSTLTITKLVIDTAGSPVPNIVDSSGALLDDNLCIVDEDGAFLMRNIEITAYNSSTGEITVESDFRFQTGELATTGAYITLGVNATTHSPYDKALDSYLIDYTAHQMDVKDLDDKSYQMREEKLQKKEGQIMAMFGSLGMSEDFIYVPGHHG